MASISRNGFRLLVLVAGVALLVTAGAGCARQDAGGGGQASSSSTAHVAPTQDTTGDAVVDDDPRTDLTGEKVVEWTDYEVVAERQLRFHFPTGTPECYGSRAAVQEDDSGIRVATVVGMLPDAPKDCPAVGREATLLVTTQAPVGDRTVEHLEAADADLP